MFGDITGVAGGLQAWAEAFESMPDDTVTVAAPATTIESENGTHVSASASEKDVFLVHTRGTRKSKGKLTFTHTRPEGRFVIGLRRDGAPQFGDEPYALTQAELAQNGGPSESVREHEGETEGDTETHSTQISTPPTLTLCLLPRGTLPLQPAESSPKTQASSGLNKII